MTQRGFRWLAIVAVLGLVATDGGRAQTPTPVHFAGSIDNNTIPNLGSWHIAGAWSLDLKGASGLGTFTAALTMERSDYFLLTSGQDVNSLATRNAHTHHIAVLNGSVTPIAGGFRVSGAATVTGNGAVAPFETTPPTSTLQIDITGGNLVAYSNISLRFGGPAVNHFGSNPVAGVVASVK